MSDMAYVLPTVGPHDRQITAELFDLFSSSTSKKLKEPIIIPELAQREILDWLGSLDFAKRFEVFMINDSQITQTLLQMTRKQALEGTNYFLRTYKEKENLKPMPIEKPEDFDCFFLSTSKPEPPSKPIPIQIASQLAQFEAKLLSNLRVFERERRFDSVCFSKTLLENFQQLLEIFKLVAGERLFTRPCSLDISASDWVWQLPSWFVLHTCQSLASWVVALMEREVWKKFAEAKQQSKRKTVEWKLRQDTLLGKEAEILQFWKSLDKPNRRKVLSESRTFLHELEQSRGLKPTPESTLAYYWQFLDNCKDREFIECLFFTRIQQAEELIPLLNGLLLKAINARYSQKIAEELIRAEESEKLGKRKKKKPKKPADSKCQCCLDANNQKTVSNCDLHKFTKHLASSLIARVLKILPNQGGSVENIDASQTHHRILENETSISVVSDTTRKHETAISVVSDTTRKCRFTALVTKARCTSNSREKGQKPEAGVSEITTFMDSNTDYESVADSNYEGSLRNPTSKQKNKVEPPVFNTKKERNLSHEKYETEQKEEKKVSECDFIEVKRKRSVKEGSYITNSACKSSVLKSKKIQGGNVNPNESKKLYCYGDNNTIKEEKKKLENTTKNKAVNVSVCKTKNPTAKINPNDNSKVVNDKKNPIPFNGANNDQQLNLVKASSTMSASSRKDIHEPFKSNKKEPQDVSINIKKEYGIQESATSNKKEPKDPTILKKDQQVEINLPETLKNIKREAVEKTKKNPIDTPTVHKKSPLETNDHQKTEDVNKKESSEKALEKRLSKEISLFIDTMRPHLEEVRMHRGVVLKRLRFILACIFPHPTDLRIFGSCATGLDLPSSDLDLGLRGFERVHKLEIPNILQFLLDNLAFYSWVKDAKCIPTASVPVLKLELDPLTPFKEFIYPNPPVYYLDLSEDFGFLDLHHPPGISARIKVDITVENCYEFDEGGFTGVRSTELINQWIGNFKNLRNVALVLKHLFNKKGFNNAYKGGFSSYCLLIILVASMRKVGCEFSSGLGMLKFIEVYAKDFDCKKIGIDLGLPDNNPFFPLPEKNPDCFTIIDPITRAKNISKSVFMCEEIIKEIRRWWSIIEKLKSEGDKSCNNLEEIITEDLLSQFLK